MNKSIKFLSLFFLLFLSINLTWAQEGQTVYLAALNAQSSDASTGSGKVKLTWVDAQGRLFDNTAVSWLNYNVDPFNMPYGTGNPSNNDAFASTAMLIGATLTATESVEDSDPTSLVNSVLRNMMFSAGADSSHLFMTPFAYFKADAQGDAGSYFAGWTFNDARVWQQDTAMDKSAPESAYFKVLPAPANVMYMVPPATVTNLTEAYTGAVTNRNNIYAVFKKYLLSNPQVTNGQLEASAGETATLYLSIDVEGDVTQYKDNFGDFVFPTYPASMYQAMSLQVQPFAEDTYGYWTWDLDDTKSPNPINLSSTKSRAYVKITYTAKSGITVGTHRTNITISVAGGAGSSSLTIPLSVNALDPLRPEATLLNGKDSIESGNFSDLLAKVGSYANPVIKLKRPQSGMTLSNKKFTLDLNGNNIGDLTVSGGDVTIAYSKFGGTMTSVKVTAGKLTLNGGTIDASGMGGVLPANALVAVNVANGATLIQNGATIRANVTMYYAIGINVDGNVTVTDGSIDAHAGMTAAFAVQVGATGKLTTTGGTFNASVDQTHTPSPSAADQSTWSNAYAVYVTDAAGEANLEGGTFTSTSAYAGAFAVCPLATFGKMTIGKKVIASAHTISNWPVSYAVGSMGAADLTVNGGRFSATYMKDDVVTPCSPFLCAGFANLEFKSAIIKADSVYVRDPMFEQTTTLVQPKLYNVVKGGADWNEGYRYIAVDESNTTALAAGVPACRIGTVGYTKLEDAIAYANNNPNEELVIFMTNNYTLPAGYYTLPAKATLVVPMSDTQSKEVNLVAPRLVYNDVNNAASDRYDNNPLIEFRRLTFASGVNMDVFGHIEMTGTQYSTNEAYTSQPVGPYGRLVMEEGSHITLQSGSEIRAWGFMTGKGETDARRGSTVREMFQMGDWKGAMTSVMITGMVPDDFPMTIANYSDKKIFPVTQYFIQNVESPVKYHPGALLSTSAAVSEGVLNMSVSMAATDIAVVGVSGQHTAIFLMDMAADAENTWVRKWYDAEHDIQVYDINSGAHIGSMELDMGELSLMGMSIPVRLNSGLFDLPITSNFKIHLLSGTMDFEQNTCLLPGAEVEVDKESTVTVAMSDEDKEAKAAATPDHVYHTGAVYVYDQADWDQYAYDQKYTKVVRYAPSALNGTGGQPNVRNENTKPASAKINVHGTFNTADGYVYTSAGGANIFSSNEDAGTFIFSNAASEADEREVYQIRGLGTSESNYETRTFTVAQLKNGDNSYTETSATGANQVYMYKDDEWHTAPALFYFDCFTAEVDMEKYAEEAAKKAMGSSYDLGASVQHIYIKPQEWVEIIGKAEIEFDWSDPADYVNDPYNPYLVGVTGNADHTFSDAVGAGRLFILMDGCQWWEVENVDNLYHCIHPNNNTYYYWDDSDDDPAFHHWAEKKFTITWKNWNGDIIQTADEDGTLQNSYFVTYGTMAEFLGTNPTRENNIDSTYNFTGWKPALGPVTQDVTYTATFESQPRMYTIIFNNEGGTEIERQFLEHKAVPVCENTPTKPGHILVWDPAISPVIGDQTYTATWLEEPPTEWDVTFVNNANGVLQATAKVGVNAHPTYSGSTPAKENADHSAYSSSEYTYTFWGWSAVIDGVAQQFAAGTELPFPTAPTTYTAVYTQGYQTYAVTFQDENKNVIETNYYRYGETPVCSATPTKENTAEYTYGFAWTPQIQTVMGAAAYTATFPATKNKYTITLTSNLSGVCTFTGAGTFEYGTNVTNVAVSYNSEKYKFNGWSDGQKDAEHPAFELTGDVTLTANFEVKSLPNLEIAADGLQTLTEATEIKDLLITSNGVTSGQLIGASYLDIKGNAIFRLQPATSYAADTWYAVAVPWRVNPSTGIYAGKSRLRLGSQIYVIEFDGAAYANAGGTDDTNQYWNFLHETGDDMVPGKLYMIYLKSGQTLLDFHKKAGAALQTRNLTVSAASGSAGTQFANWNAIANPALYTADLSTGVTQFQTYDNNDGQTYTVVDASTNNLIVAKPIFVQVTTPGTVYATVHSGASPAPAYRRSQQAENEAKFVVEISRNGKMADRLIVETTDEKEDKYVIGQDLAKFGVSSKVAQMWINRYDSKLCVNTVELESDAANFPLSVFAPAAGEYTIHLTPYTSDSDYSLYLTYDGQAVWNLSYGAFTAYLSAGTDNHYGLRIVAKAPQTATGVDEAIVDSKDATAAKVLINGQVFIIRGDKVYSVDGRLIK